MSAYGLTVRVEQLLSKYSHSAEALSALKDVLTIVDTWAEENSSNDATPSHWLSSRHPSTRGPPPPVPLRNRDMVRKVRDKSVKLKYDHSTISNQQIIKCQRLVKSWLIRNRLRKFSNTLVKSGEFKSQRKRNEVWREILITEERYVKNLQGLDEYYFQPIKESLTTTKQILSRADFVAVFSKVFQSILSFNQELLSVLHAFAKSWPSKTSIGLIFLQRVPFIKIYASYVNNFSQSYIVRQKHKNNQTWQQFCRDAQKAMKGLTLSDLLIMPIQRIPRYQMLLAELFKYTPTEHVDYENLKKALKAMEDMTEELEERKKEAENLQQIIYISNHISGDVPELVVPGRKYIREGGIKKGSSIKKKRYFYLFSDMLVITTILSDNTKSFTSAFYLDELTTADIKATCSFTIHHGRKRYKYTADTIGEKTGWIVDINEAAEHYKTTPSHLSQTSPSRPSLTSSKRRQSSGGSIRVKH